MRKIPEHFYGLPLWIEIIYQIILRPLAVIGFITKRQKTIATVFLQTWDIEVAKKPNNTGRFLVLLRKRGYDYCFRCGTKEKLTIDHVLPRKLGGRTTIKNIQILCGDCNVLKNLKQERYGYIKP